MTNEMGPGRTRSFVTSLLPWLLGACMLTVYLLTLYRTATPYSLERLAEIRGWSWNPSPFAPLAYLLTLPLRALSGTAAVVGLNLFNAICAALTLVLLARSVALLPHDRTNEQREREGNEFSLLSIPMAWLPPVFAVLICGLQLTFWEHAIEFRQQSVFDNGEMLNLLLFAYVIRCLLEFRLNEKESWLLRCALVYGLAMANNWAMASFLPAFLVALVWIKGFEFFNVRFLLKMAGCGLAGLTVLLVYPVVIAAGQAPHFDTFWQILSRILMTDKAVLFHLYFPKEWLLLMSLTSLLPVVVIGIKWASSFGDNSPLGILLAKSAFNIIHAFFLLACLWVALGPPFGPRQLVSFIPFLTFYYLGAISVGYFTGYFLLVCVAKPIRARQRIRPLVRWLNWGAVVCVCVISAVIPAILGYRNLTQLNENRATLDVFDRYLSRIGDVLPAQGAVILSDEAMPLRSLEAALDGKGMASSHLFIETGSLKNNWPYLKFLEQRHPEFDLTSAYAGISSNGATDINCIHILERLAEKHEIYYIHASFGYYFERFYVEPRGVAYRLTPYTTNDWFAPALTSEQMKENQSIWKETEPDLEYLANRIKDTRTPEHPDFWQQLTNVLRLAPEPNLLATAVGKNYSKALDYWGVRLGDSGLLKEAGECFDLAQKVSPDNVSAGINSEFNGELRAGKTLLLRPLRAFDDRIGKHTDWLQVFNECGPIADPGFCMELGTAFGKGLNYRQAAEQYQRAQSSIPQNPFPSLQICQLLLAFPYHANDAYYSYPSVAQTYAEALVAANKAAGMPANIFTPAALYLKGVCLVQLAGFESDPSAAHGQFSNALAAAGQALKIIPNEPNSLFLKSVCLIQLERHSDAIPVLDQLLLVQTNNYAAWLNRGIANLKTDHLDAAKRDYEFVAATYPKTYQVLYGLGEIAYREKDNAAAIKNYELYLANVPPNLANSDETKLIMTRLEELKRDPR